MYNWREFVLYWVVWCKYRGLVLMFRYLQKPSNLSRNISEDKYLMVSNWRSQCIWIFRNSIRISSGGITVFVVGKYQHVKWCPGQVQYKIKFLLFLYVSINYSKILLILQMEQFNWIHWGLFFCLYRASIMKNIINQKH